MHSKTAAAAAASLDEGSCSCHACIHPRQQGVLSLSGRPESTRFCSENDFFGSVFNVISAFNQWEARFIAKSDSCVEFISFYVNIWSVIGAYSPLGLGECVEKIVNIRLQCWYLDIDSRLYQCQCACLELPVISMKGKVDLKCLDASTMTASLDLT